MNQQNSEFEISGIQLRESRTQPRVSMSREIGEAQIVHPIFGKAKVRIIRKHDKMRRALWWAGVAGTAAIAAVVWQGWLASQQTELSLSASSLPAASPEVQSGVAAALTENLLYTAASSPVSSLPGTSAETMNLTIPQRLISQQANEIRAAEKAAAMPPVEQSKPAVVRQRPAAVRSTPAAVQSEPVAAQPKPILDKPGLPVVPKPKVEDKTSALPPAAANNALKNQTDAPLPAKPRPSAVPAAATARVTQPAASSPVAVVPLAPPLIKEYAAPQLPTGDKPLSDPVNTSGK
jgi:hypothetical protein